MVGRISYKIGQPFVMYFLVINCLIKRMYLNRFVSSMKRYKCKVRVLIRSIAPLNNYTFLHLPCDCQVLQILRLLIILRKIFQSIEFEASIHITKICYVEFL